MLFEGRLGHTLYRPAGMRWFHEGFWKINDQIDTAQQFLAEAPPKDGTRTIHNTDHRTITYDEFLDTDFGLIIASVPQHIQPFEKLARMKHCPFAMQVGNNWDLGLLAGHNILASVKSVYGPHMTNVCYYRQEFDTNIFCRPDEEPSELRVSSYVNCLSEWPVGWTDFLRMEKDVTEKWNGYGDVTFRSFGGQCRDGNMNGPHELAGSMQKDTMVFHVKDYGDGYGHVVHNALACGRPIIYRGRFTKGTMIGDLLNENNSFDLDEGYWEDNVANIIHALGDSYALKSMSEQAYKSFKANVDFADDARRVGEWLQTL